MSWAWFPLAAGRAGPRHYCIANDGSATAGKWTDARSDNGLSARCRAPLGAGGHRRNHGEANVDERWRVPWLIHGCAMVRWIHWRYAVAAKYSYSVILEPQEEGGF